MIYFLIGSMILNVVMGYVIINQLRKTETYEDAIERYFVSTINILRTARSLDDKQMFEKDDEVGTLFQQLMLTIGELRAVIYDEATYEGKTTDGT